jgi:hypothetical protein
VKAVDGICTHSSTISRFNVNLRFLLAQLHMDSLMSQPTLGHIKRALQNLLQGIKGLDETYERVTRKVERPGGRLPRACETGSVLGYLRQKERFPSRRYSTPFAVGADMADMDEDFLPEIEILGSVCAVNRPEPKRRHVHSLLA